MKDRSDCAVTWKPGPEPLTVRLASSVGSLFGRAIEAAARGAAAECGVVTGELLVEDDGALDFVVAARVEAALRAAGFRRASAPPRVSGKAPARAARPGRRRTRLYLPGNQPDFLPNAGLYGADCLVLDLEDSVAPARKEEARILVRRLLEAGPDFARGAELALRINDLRGPFGAADLAELGPCLPGLVVLPKCEGSEELRELDAILSRIEAETGRAPLSILVLPILETARGILRAEAIAEATPRLAGLSFGAEDFLRDICARRTPGGSETLLARQGLVLAARAAGLPPLDSVYADTADEAGFAAWCAASRDLGFEGCGILHPRQIEIAHRAYSPSEEEIAEASRVVAALDEALARGSGVATLDGKMVDAPVAERARRLLDAARPPAGPPKEP